MADKFELPESPMEQITRIANHCETKALKGSEKFYQCMRSQQPVRQAEMNVWDPDSESLWHKLKTVWKNRAYDATPEQTIRKGLDPVLREVLPAEEIEEGWHKGKEAIGEIKDGNIMSGAGALGSAVGGTVIKGGYSKTVGKIVPKSWEKKAGEITDEIKEEAEEIIDYISGKVGLSVNGKPYVKCGELGQYKNTQDAEKGTPTAMNRDHMPNTGLMLEKLEENKKFKKVEKVTKRTRKGNKRKVLSKKAQQECIKRNIEQEAITLGMPECLHKAGRTYKNKAKSIEKSDSLKVAQGKDIDLYEQMLGGDFSKVDEDDVDEAKECVKKIDDDCKGKLKDALKEKRKTDPDDFIDDMIEMGCSKGQLKNKGLK